MKLPPAVHWHEGMLLAPQHFQQTSRRSEALQQYHASIVSPFHWGLVEMDDCKLAGGKLSIGSVEAILPDGLVISHSGESELAIDLNEHKKDIGDGNTVWLTVAARQPGERFRERYEYTASQVVDEDSGADDVPLQSLRPRLKLILGDALPQSSVGIPIAKVVARSQGIEQTDYEPPWLVVRERSVIHTICRDLAALLREKADGLAMSIANESESLRGPQLLETRMLVHSLVSGLPALELLLASGAAHPFTLYLALAGVAGALAPGHIPRRIDVYDHHDLLNGFQKVRKLIEQTIATAIRAPFTLRPFTFDADGFRVTIDPAWLRQPMFLGVRAAPGVKAKELDQWVMQSVIGAASKIAELREWRTIGVKRAPARETDLLPATGVAFYKLVYDQELVRPSEELVIANGDRERRPEEVVLYVNCEAQT